MSHTIAVMYLGQDRRVAATRTAVALEPQHPYTKALFAAALPIDLDTPREEIVLSGRGAEPARSAERLPLPPALPARDAALRHRGAGASRRRPADLVACHLYD